MTRIPKVALIGVPNSGKSSLLNRLTSSNKAVVDKVENTTRDLNIAEEVWENMLVQFVDTGGVVPKTDDLILKQVQIKSWEAVASSDLLLWLIDRKKEVEVIPQNIIQRIWKAGKPVILVITKVDDPNLARDWSEYAMLGADDFVNISCHTGYGFNDLMDKVIEQLKKLGFEENFQIKNLVKTKTKKNKTKEVRPTSDGKYVVVRDEDNTFVSQSLEENIVDVSQNLIWDLYGVLIDEKTKNQNEDLANFILQKKAEGFNHYYLSNLSSQSLENYLDTTILKYFDGGVISQETGFSKPSPEIYKHLLKKYELNEENSVFIDDNFENLETAKNLGLKTILYKNFENLVENFEILYPPQIPKVLFFGRPNVGKSSLFNAMSGKDFQIVSPIAGTTVSVNDLTISRTQKADIELENKLTGEFDILGYTKLKRYILVDSAGIRRPGQRQSFSENLATYKTIQSANTSDILALVLDGSTPISKQDQLVAGICREVRRSTVILVNKSDLVTPELKAKFLKDFQYKLGFLKLDKFLWVSSLADTFHSSEQGFISSKEEIWKAIDTAFEQTKSEISREFIRKLFNFLIKRKPPKKLHNKKKPIMYDLLLTKQNPLTFELLVKDKTTIHWSYLRFIENLLRQNLNLQSSPITIKVVEVDRSKVLDY